MIEINQAQRCGQKLDLCCKAKPALASEAEVPKGQCKKQTGPEGTLTHQVSVCDPQTACLGHCLNWNVLKMPSALLWFEQLTSSFPSPKPTKWSNAGVAWEHPAWATHWHHACSASAGAGPLYLAHCKWCFTTLSGELSSPGGDKHLNHPWWQRSKWQQLFYSMGEKCLCYNRRKKAFSLGKRERERKIISFCF